MSRLILLVMLGAAAAGSYCFYQWRVAPANPGPPVHQDSAPVEFSDPVDAGPNLPEELLWQADPRWLEALPIAQRGVERARELYRWHEEVGGDPLYFRREKEAIAAELYPALEQLRNLREDLEHHPAALLRIDREIQMVQQAIGGSLR